MNAASFNPLEIMNKRIFLIFLAWSLCFGAGWAVMAQRRELTRLRAEQEHAVVRAGPAYSEIDDNKGSAETDAVADADSGELLRLRSEVTRLNARKRELAEVVKTHEHLRAQLASGPTNTAGNQLPPGYIRKSEAQFAGYSTPENTVQTFLWAVHRHDINGLLQSFSPEMSAKIAANGGADSFFKNAGPMPGLAIRSRNNLPDGSVELEIEIGPSMPTDKLHLSPINGEWKFDSFF
jgi:hypothetical protein